MLSSQCAAFTAPPPFPPSRRGVESSHHRTRQAPLRVRGRQAPHPQPPAPAVPPPGTFGRDTEPSQPSKGRQPGQPSKAGSPVSPPLPASFSDRDINRQEKTEARRSDQLRRIDQKPGGAGADPTSHPTSQARPGFQYPEPTPRSSPRPLPDSTPKNKKDLQSAGGGASPNIATPRIERLALSQSCSASAGICQGRQQARQGTARWRSKHTTHDTRC